MPFRGDDGIFEEDFIEDRRKGLEVFVNKWVYCFAHTMEYDTAYILHKNILIYISIKK